ncbi:MAG: 3-dehydroquinate synthase [Gammaproteobacteria bacterium]|nr:3-dehydroquinate synthase [Gammaproteobacteria bacterium]
MPLVITLSLASRSYPIYVGQHLLTKHNILLPYLSSKQIMIVTQENIASLYLPILKAALADYPCDVMYLPNGEQYKNIEQWQGILEKLIEQRHERNTTLIALGGGIVGDMTGFAAACYLRGVNFIQIPTTLIAQVDAAIGGKTAINHASGKNMIGAFYQPRCVIADIDFLQTLSAREYRAGLAEVVKYGLIQDADFFQWLEANMALLLSKDESALLYAVHKSASIKANFVSQDEKEQGLRSLLNLGHTFGHALEVANHYEGILHGEAVAVGIIMASFLSMQLGWISSSDHQRIQALFDKIGCMKNLPALPLPSDFIRFMQHDKKVEAGKVHFILLKGIGQAIKTSVVTDQQLKQTIEWAADLMVNV